MGYDFCGWATRNNIQCSDGRIIRKDAFKGNDGQKVPLVWNHQHNDPTNILGHAVLENREDGVYAYCTFNNTDAARDAKSLVEHGDISSLSIYANKLKQNGPNVMHGQIREVSLVLAGANPEAYIENIISHGEDSDDEAIMYFGEDIELEHSDGVKEELDLKKEANKMAEKNAPEKDDRTIGDVFDTLNEDQKTAVYAIIGQILEDNGISGNNSKEDDEKMKHNVFEGDTYDSNDTLSHSDMQAIISDAKRYGSMKDAVLAHGIEHIDYLFPEAANVENMPSFIQRDMTWVGEVMNAVHHTPFSRIKSTFANITEDDARAKGYIKGKKKKDEVFSLLKRTTSPTTIYKKQKLDRDDVVDITDFDVVAWLKSEMRMMLDEEIARAILVGDGRLSSSDDKINEQNIRPIYTDDSLYTIREQIKFSATATADEKAKSFIRQSIKARKEYKGSGSPILYTTEDVLTDCLLLEDTTGRIIYDTVEKLATALRVKKIVTVPVMEGYKKTGEDSKEYSLMGIIVNLADYNVGADKGGAVNMFDDFDIDYNAQKYLIETRCSGALIKPYSAIVIEAATE
jgi:caudovirus prohead protease|nr:MAG TPA: major capsid protein [Caudoviricetes sp.]